MVFTPHTPLQVSSLDSAAEIAFCFVQAVLFPLGLNELSRYCMYLLSRS